jgi:hypothetical protein
MDTTASDPTPDFAKAIVGLARHAEGLPGDIVTALGLPAGVSPNDAVVAWHIEQREVLSIYALSTGALTIYERAASGETLTLTVPVERLARVVLGSGPQQAALTLELDADQVTLDTEAEYFEQAVPEGTGIAGRSRARSVQRRSGYVLNADTPEQIVQLKRFYRMVAAVLHGRA